MIDDPEHTSDIRLSVGESLCCRPGDLEPAERPFHSSENTIENTQISSESPVDEDTNGIHPVPIAPDEGRSLFVDALAFQPFTHAQSVLKDMLVQRELTFFVFLFAFLCVFKFVFGSLAVGSFLFWIGMIFILARVQGLANSVYIATVNNTGIRLGRRNSIFQLDLPWQKLNNLHLRKVEEQERLIISLRPKTVHFIQQQLFQDILGPSGKVEIAAAKGSQDEKAFFAEVLNRCPSELLDQSSECSVPAEKAAAGKDGYAISYEPFKRERREISGFLKKFESLLVLAGAMIVLVLPFRFGAPDVFSGLLSFVVGGMLLVSMVRGQCLTLLIDCEGISLLWLFFGTMQKSKVIPWQSIEFVSHAVQFGRSQKTEQIILKLNAEESRLNNYKVLEKLSSELLRSTATGNFELVINTDALAGAAGRRDLLEALSRYLPEEMLSNGLKECLNPTSSASYTQLWLDSLSDFSERRFAGCISPGQRLCNGKYEIEEFIGAGGQASVYRAKIRDSEQMMVSESKSRDDQAPDNADSPILEPGENRRVVLKEFVLPSHAGADLSVRSLEHITRELELMKKLKHENIVEYYDLFVDDQRCYLVLEHIEGISLRELVEKDGPLCSIKVRELSRQMAGILKHLHSQTPAIVHRDFTPENLILDSSGKLKLVDFNIAQELEANSTKTVAGKQSYLPPEQFRGKACPQSDIYAMGATMHFLLTGEDPEPITCAHPLILNESIDPEMDALVAACTELELPDRLKSADEFLCLLSGEGDSEVQS